MHIRFKGRIHTFIMLFLIALTAGMFIHAQNQSTYLLSDISSNKMKELNEKYSFAMGEDLYNSTSHSNTLASLLSNDVLTDFADPDKNDNQGLIVQFKNEDQANMILMTPKSKLDEDQLWKISEEYMQNIPEIKYAEPDIELEIYSTDLASTNLLSQFLKATLPKVSPPFQNLTPAKHKRYDEDKWWKRKEKKNHSLRARLRFANSGTRAPIAILDSGMDTAHPYFENRVWKNTREKFNNLDDDNNKYADDIHGWDFTRSKGDTIEDNIGHGTHVGGIITKFSKNPIAVLKVFDKKSESRLSYAIKAIKYSADNGMRVLNISFGTKMSSKSLKDIVDYTYSKGAFIVAAAGNNSSSEKHYPAAYDKVIAVGALNKDGSRLEDSNYGSWIDVTAPGERVISTIPNNRYGFLTGTSQAAPFVTAYVANIVHKNPNIDINGLKMELAKIDFSQLTGPSPKDRRN